MRCRAIRDGLLGTAYVRAGELFQAEQCPAWAEEVVTAQATKRAAPRPPKTRVSGPGSGEPEGR